MTAPRRGWLVMLATTLVLALAAAAYVQWRQYDLLDSSVHYQNDALGWSFFQLETEHLRLRNEMHVALADLSLAQSRAAPRESLQNRYDIFVSRIGLVDHERAARIMPDHGIYTQAMLQVRAFVDEADRYLGEKPAAALDVAALRQLLVQLDGLSVPLHELSLGASHLLYERVSQRNAAVRTQSKLSLGLTLFQCVLLIAFALIVLRQFRSLSERGERLQALADNLAVARTEAESASRAKSVFLANMSHEIRTPFHGMLGMMSLLQDTPLSKQQAGFLATAKDSANHLLAILNDILDISKLESGNLQVAPQPLDLVAMLGQVDALMRVQAHAKGLQLQVSIAPDVPHWVNADATRLKQILFNLLSNALKFSNAGMVSLAVTRQADGALLFSVVDTGIGMDAAMLSRLFQRFSQGDDTTSRRHGGAGLGLEISRSLARLMGGDIAVSSQAGVGSRFVVTLPLPAVAAPGGAMPGLAADGTAPARPLRVLVAEDHPVNRAYLEAVLDKLGHQAVFSENGEQAVRAVQAQDFDVVLMDLHMPLMDGFAAARAIRAMPPPKGELPIIALTADAFQESQERTRQAGMNGFLTKPAHLPQLREVLGRYGQQATPVFAAVDGSTAAASASPLDQATVDNVSVALSPGKYAELLGRFFGLHSGTLQSLRQTHGRRDHESMRSQAHALKGAALSLGLRSVADSATRLQEAAAEGSTTPVEPLLDELDRHMGITRDLCVKLGLL
ncbi:MULTISPECIES: ATP-binding protein [unclassified Rhizobacter]|uniref:ATP-binding protein n=1 Tax=unclassified Rhizobacter TaxID=2640088 RepID=UPI00138F9B33|nr:MULTISPECIES: ATP-binding protein [unclassified Rhizobacter]